VTHLADVFMWCWCWAAYQVVVHALPQPHTYADWRQRLVSRVELWLLPYAGYYGYHDPEFHTWRWSGRNR
jgi:hypothetical protein